MDTLSHACFSYLVCRTTRAAKSPRMGLVAAATAVLPDLDFLIIPALPDLARFAFHRGPSHSLFIALIIGFLLGGLLHRWLNLSWVRSSLLITVAWISHLLLDMCTGFGVALLWPITHARFSFDLLFVVDLLASLLELEAGPEFTDHPKQWSPDLWPICDVCFGHSQRHHKRLSS